MLAACSHTRRPEKWLFKVSLVSPGCRAPIPASPQKCLAWLGWACARSSPAAAVWASIQQHLLTDGISWCPTLPSSCRLWKITSVLCPLCRFTQKLTISLLSGQLKDVFAIGLTDTDYRLCRQQTQEKKNKQYTTRWSLRVLPLYAESGRMISVRTFLSFRVLDIGDHTSVFAF